MDNRIKTALTSDTFTPQRSQYIGKVTDNSIIIEVEGTEIIPTNAKQGEQSPSTTIIQRLNPNVTEINKGFMAVNEIKKFHIPPQIKKLGDEAFPSATRCKEINLENIEVLGNASLPELNAGGNKPIVLHLDSVKEIGSQALASAYVVVYLNKDVSHVEAAAFGGIPHLYYDGDLEGAPWDAQAWN